jgi:hypothetical protein
MYNFPLLLAKSPTNTYSQLNVSRIGRNLLSQSSTSTDPLTSFLHNLTDPILKPLENDLNNLATSLAKDLGLKDFYSVHLMDYCDGSYTPGPVPNATLKKSKIDRNVTFCSNRTAMFTFDPTAVLQKSLNDSGLGITLTQLSWPDKIEEGIKDLRTAFKAAFILYCMGIGFAFLTLIASALWIGFDVSRGTALIVIALATLAWMCLGIASAIMTAVGVKGEDIIDKYGKPIGVSADRGNGFIGLSWGATACMVLAGMVGCAGCFMRRKRTTVRPYGEKP